MSSVRNGTHYAKTYSKTWIHEVSISILLSRGVQYLGYDGGFA